MVLRHSKPGRKVGHTVKIPVPAEKKTSLLRWKSIQKGVNRLYKFPAVNFLFHTVRIRYQLCDFLQNSRNFPTSSFVGRILFVAV